jgi:hypothetical protein
MTAIVPRGGLVRRAQLLVVCLAAMACQRELTLRERARLYAWLQCEECVDGELAAVTALGKSWRTGGATVDSLSDDLLAGPSAERRNNVAQQFVSSFLEDSAHADSAGTQLPVSSIEYAQYYQYNFVNLYRVRAAIALAEIGGAKARAVLDSAVARYTRTAGDTLRGDAQLEVKRARDGNLGESPGAQSGTSDGPVQ